MKPRFKTFVLLALLTALLLFVGQLVGSYTGLIIAGIIVVLMNVVSLFYADKMILKMYKAKPASKSSRLYKVVHKLCEQEGMPMPKVFELPQDQPNAFATGRSPKHASVAATRGLLHMMNEDELEGVMAHELCHVKHYDTLLQTAAATIAGVISYVATMAQWAAIFGGFGRGDDEGGGNIVSLLVLIIVTPIVATLLQLALSRSREFLADAGAAKMTGNPTGLASALKKLEQGTAQVPMKDGTNAVGSMFIANPYKKVSFSELMSTHPPTKKRVARLESMK